LVDRGDDQCRVTAAGTGEAGGPGSGVEARGVVDVVETELSEIAALQQVSLPATTRNSQSGDKRVNINIIINE